MNYSIDITVATKRDLADAFDYIDGMLMNPSAADRLIDNAWKQFRSLDIFPQRFPIVTDPMSVALRWQVLSFPLVACIVLTNMLMQTIRKPVRANIVARRDGCRG